ncbi:MAG TPA: ABC transporter permease [Terriglobales bacterium]|nr:ABC transporter permease [Terriglobales bacterium]
MLSTVLADLVFAIRQFRRSPGFTVTVVLTLALGIGATTAIFSLVDGVLLRPLRFRQPERLVAIDTLEFPPGVTPTNIGAADYRRTSYPDLFDWRTQSRTFESLASCDPTSRLFSKPDGTGSRVLSGARISANLFSMLGVSPMLGRNFRDEEELAGHRVVILSHELWISDFGASPDVLGQTVKISDELHTIVGVMPANFHYPISQPAYFWATFAVDNEGAEPTTSLRDEERLSVVGRLKPGVKIEQALADLNTVQSGLAQRYSEDRHKLAVSVLPLLDETVSEVRSALWLLLAAVTAVLIIGCANVAGLLLARANTRSQEMAVRQALGASRSRILRQLLLEALLLAAAAGIAGIATAFVLIRVGLSFVPNDLPRLAEISIDPRVLAFAVFVSILTALLFGLLPAWKMSQLDPSVALKEGGPAVTTGRRRNRLHHTLVVAETALGFTLLIGSGLLIRSMQNVLHIDPGFDTKHTVAFDIALTAKRYPDPSKVPFFDKLLPQLAALSGVEKASGGHPLPLQWPNNAAFTIPGHLNSPDDLPSAVATAVAPDYFEALSIPLVRGRTFVAHDNDSKSHAVAMINQSFARKYFPGEDPIGRYLMPQPEHIGEAVIGRQIIGIVGDTRMSDITDPYQPQFFLPYAQDPSHQRPLVVLKVAGDPASYENAVRRVVANIDKDAPVFRYRTFADDIKLQAAQQRFEAVLLSGFASIALLLSAVGLYAVLSYIVAERTRELGLRMALGASRSDVLRLVLQRGLSLACVGIVIGALTSFLGTRLIADTLFNVEPTDHAIFSTVALVFMFVSVAATLIPAVRAANVDPIRTLREH